MRIKDILFRILLAGIMLYGNLLMAQNKFEISSGGGLFDGFFLKAKYGKYIQLGLSQDIASPLKSTAFEIYYRLPKKSNSEALRKYYLMLGIAGTIFGKGYDYLEKAFLYPRIGRSFLLSKESGKFGLNIDLGVCLMRSSNPPDGYITEFVPFSGSIGLFLRL